MLHAQVFDLSCCFLPCPFSLFYLIGDVEIFGRDLDLEVQQRSKGLLVGCKNIKLFDLLPTRQLHMYAAMPTFWHDLESLRLLFESMPLRFLYVWRLLAGDVTSLTS